MARQNIRPNPAEKLFEAYVDFSGGLNSEISNERLRDNEFPVMENVDLASRGSAKKRSGRREIITSYPYTTENAQGIFFYYRQGQPYPDMIVAVNGKLYVKEHDKTTMSEVVIRDTENNNAVFTFQKTLPVEAVQYREYLIIATGTKLCELTYKDNAWSAQIVVPYKPTNMEAIWIGTNALSPDPSSYASDGVSTALEVAAIVPNKRKGNVNQPTKFTAYINKPSSITSVDYKWEYRKTGTTEWKEGRDFTAQAAGKEWEFTPDEIAPYDIKVTVRETGKTETKELTLTRYDVQPVEDKQANEPKPSDAIHSCRKILLHWDRILLAGDSKHPYQMYISELENHRYFPTANTINFDTGKQEPITALVKFRGLLVVFTRTSIQTLSGKDVSTYSRNLVHDEIGCIAGRTAKVVGNNIMFLSHEGIFMIKPNQLILEAMNVQRVDYNIKSDIPLDRDACAVVSDGQYFICFPQHKTIYRLYYESGAWVKDVSNKLDIVEFLTYGEDVYNLTSTGRVYMHDKEVFTDAGETYRMYIESKFLDFSASFNLKRVRRLYIMAKNYTHWNVGLKVTVQADAAIVLTPEVGKAVVNPETHYVEWVSVVEPNVTFDVGTTLGMWEMGHSRFGDTPLSVHRSNIRGKARRVKVAFEEESPNVCEIYGFGIEFKLKKP